MTSPTGTREALLAAARTELAEHGRAGISLRAVARRAGVSHALPKYHFQDRAGLLTAIATEGFLALRDAFSQVSEQDPQQRRAKMGHAYVDFGLAHPALFDLMFQPAQLHPGDPALRQAQGEAIGLLAAAVSGAAPADANPPGAPMLALASWALVHGLVVLARDGALQSRAGTDTAGGVELAHQIADLFASFVGERLRDGRNSL